MANQPEITNQIVLVWGTSMMLFLATMVALFVYLFQRKLIKRKLAYQKIEDLLHQQELKSAYALLEGEDMERQRIAREIHDNIGGILATLNIYADTMSRENNEARKEEYAQKISELTKTAVDEVRKIAHRLDATQLRYFGLRKAIDDLIATVNHSALLNADAHIDLMHDVSNDISMNLYRITQELINNTLKYAKASTVHIHITDVNHEYISFIYEDNGVGFNLDQVKKTGMGLNNITARIDKLQGQYNIETKQHHGFSISIEIPIS